MKSIVFTATGSPIHLTRECGARGGGDTLGILNKLIDDFPNRVVLFGKINGDVPDGLLAAINTTTKGLACEGRDGYWDSESEIKAFFDVYVNQLREYDPLCMIEMSGPAPTWCWPYNENYVGIMDFGFHYCSPQLYAVHKLNLPRYLIVTDPKCWKRDGEMARMWPAARPKAVLTQQEIVFDKIVQGRNFKVHAAYAGCEYWYTYGMERVPPVEKVYEFLIASNTHESSSQLSKRRRMVWHELIHEMPDGTAICGHGWDRVSGLERFNVFGEIKSTAAVYDLMNQSVGGPMIPQVRGFNTTKPRLYALHNCCPYPYGRGEEEFTYDADQRIWSYDHPMRWNPNQLLDREEYIQWVLDKTTPDFSRLHQLIEATERGEAFGTSQWLKTFGGYV